MTPSALDYFKSLIRESFDKADIQQRQEIIDRLREFGMHELDEYADELYNDLEADLKK